MPETSAKCVAAATATARRLVLAAILIPSVLALAMALTAERVFGIVGCDFCVLQRYPYVLTAAFAGAALLWPRPVVLRLAFAVCAGFFALGCGLSAYHVGIQQGWWTEAGLCAGSLPTPPPDLRALRVERRPACDEIDWNVLGLSLAALNGIYSAALALAAALVSIRCGRGSRPTIGRAR